MAEAIRVLVADDHSVVRAGLVNILESEPDIKVVAQARDGLEAINKAPELNPNVILMDILMPRCTGLEATAAIKEKNPDVRVLILTVSEQEEDLLQALKFGAQGYLLKSATATEIADAARRTAAGEVVLSPGIAAKLVAEFHHKADAPELSSREMEVLQLLGQGLTNANIANKPFISESTVRTYLSRILDKLHLKTMLRRLPILPATRANSNCQWATPPSLKSSPARGEDFSPLARILTICYPNTQEGQDRPDLPRSKKTVVKRGRPALVLQEPEQLRGPYKVCEPESLHEDGTKRRERSTRCKRTKSM